MSSLYREEEFFPAGCVELDFTGLFGTNCCCDGESLEAIAGAVPSGPALNWIDTGDYHYLSALTTATVQEPFELLLLDHHTDRQKPGFDVLSCGGWVAWSEERNPHLRHVVTIGPPGCGREPFDRTLPLYVSLDLDVLDKSVFSTNWDQGTMSFEEMKSIILDAKKGRRLLGADVCGGITVSKGARREDLERNRLLRQQLLLENLFDD